MLALWILIDVWVLVFVFCFTSVLLSILYLFFVKELVHIQRYTFIHLCLIFWTVDKFISHKNLPVLPNRSLLAFSLLYPPMNSCLSRQPFLHIFLLPWHVPCGWHVYMSCHVDPGRADMHTCHEIFFEIAEAY